MKNVNRKIEEPESKEEDVVETEKSIQPKTERVTKSKRTFIDIIGGDILATDKFVSLFPFLIYVVALMMLWISNTYYAEDMNREIADLNKRKEDLYVENMYLKSEITKISKQSTLVKKLKKQGIKESVVPMKKIVIEKEGGRK